MISPRVMLACVWDNNNKQYTESVNVAATRLEILLMYSQCLLFTSGREMYTSSTGTKIGTKCLHILSIDRA
jgi:hypothetical protein